MVDAQAAGAVIAGSSDLLPMFDALVDATRALAGAARKERETQGAGEAREGSFA